MANGERAYFIQMIRISLKILFTATLCTFYALQTAIADVGYYDLNMESRTHAYSYLDKLEQEIGTDVYETLPPLQALDFAQKLGSIDLLTMTSAACVQHLQGVAKIRSNYYQAEPLTDTEVNEYLLPYRIRYEPTRDPIWFAKLQAHFTKIIKQKTITTADEAAQAVLAWIHSQVKLESDVMSYHLSIAGDVSQVDTLAAKKATEINHVILSIAALRSMGVAARMVYAPSLRGMTGGKIWLEYLDEKRQWQCQVPSLGAPGGHKEKIIAELGDNLAKIYARPEAPQEITASYLKVSRIAWQCESDDILVNVMILSKEGLASTQAFEAGESAKIKQCDVGPGYLILTANFGNRSYALMPIKAKPNEKIIIEAGRGKILIKERKDHQP